MKELWTPIKGFKGQYLISNLGHCKSLDRIVVDKRGYKKHLKGVLLKRRWIIE